MSSISKMLSILDLFTEKKPVWTSEEIINELHFSTPTGYRYLRELSNSGLLTNENGKFAIGPKIIQLDCLIRESDPTIKNGRPIMNELMKLTGCEVLLSNIYNNQILIVHIETQDEAKSIVTYKRGMPHPLFRGATAKIIISNLNRNQLSKLYEQHKDEIEQSNLGRSFDEFRAHLASIRKQGYYISHEELDRGVSGIAVPVFSGGNVKGALCLVIPTQSFEYYNKEKLIETLLEASDRITQLSSESSDKLFKRRV